MKVVLPCLKSGGINGDEEAAAEGTFLRVKGLSSQMHGECLSSSILLGVLFLLGMMEEA